MEKVMLGVTEVMKKMGIGRDTAYQIMNGSNFHTIKVGRRLLVHEEVLETWLRGEAK